MNLSEFRSKLHKNMSLEEFVNLVIQVNELAYFEKEAMISLAKEDFNEVRFIIAEKEHLTN